MSLHKWFSKESGSYDNGAFKAAEKAVQAIESQQKGKKRKSTERHCYDQATKTAIGKYAIINGNKRTVEKFSKELGFAISEATVRNFKRVVSQQLFDSLSKFFNMVFCQRSLTFKVCILSGFTVSLTIIDDVC